jgi:hypothetical protein
VPELAHRLDAAAGTAIRRYVEIMEQPHHAHEAPDWREVNLTLIDHGVFAPIEMQLRPNDRARCRLCGHVIPQGADAIAFRYDRYAARAGHWGRLNTSYVHARFCPPPKA